MIFQYTHDWIAGVSPHTNKPKTATTRIKKTGDYLRDGHVLDRHGRLRFGFHQVRGVQPNRGRTATGKIKILSITEIAPSEFTDCKPRKPTGFSRAECQDSFFAPQWHIGFEVYSK